MLKYLLILFLPLSVAVASCQTSRPAGSSAQVDTERLDNSLLWHIEGKGARTSYLFATIHIIDEDSYFLPEGTN